MAKKDVKLELEENLVKLDYVRCSFSCKNKNEDGRCNIYRYSKGDILKHNALTSKCENYDEDVSKIKQRICYETNCFYCFAKIGESFGICNAFTEKDACFGKPNMKANCFNENCVYRNPKTSFCAFKVIDLLNDGYVWIGGPKCTKFRNRDTETYKYIIQNFYKVGDTILFEDEEIKIVDFYRSFFTARKTNSKANKLLSVNYSDLFKHIDWFKE